MILFQVLIASQSKDKPIVLFVMVQKFAQFAMELGSLACMVMIYPHALHVVEQEFATLVMEQDIIEVYRNG